MYSLLRIYAFHTRFSIVILLLAAITLIIFNNGCRQLNTAHTKSEATLIAVMKDDVASLKRLDRSGADLNAAYPNRFNWTPIIASIYFQSSNVIQYLLNRGVDINKRDVSGNTALLWAIQAGDTNTARLMVKRYSQPLRENDDWNLVWSVASISEHP